MISEEAEIDVAIERLLQWLTDKPEDVWLDCVERINWDDGGWLLLAIVSHNRCTKQIAARIFWSSGPDIVAKDLLSGQKLEYNVEGNLVIERILQNWSSNIYKVGSIAMNSTSYTHDEYLESLAPHADPLDIPEDLFKKFDGRPPNVDPTVMPENNPYVWDLYYALNIAYEPRPE